MCGALLGAVHGYEVLPVAQVSRIELGWVMDRLGTDLAVELEVIGGKWLLAYNAPFDRDALLRGLQQADHAPGRLATSRHWRCLMRLRAVTEDGRWAKLGGPHHALGDCLAALQVLQQLAARPTSTPRHHSSLPIVLPGR